MSLCYEYGYGVDIDYDNALEYLSNAISEELAGFGHIIERVKKKEVLLGLKVTMREDNIEDGFWVFVSHSTKDFERVRLVRNALEVYGHRPILFYLKCLENEIEVNDLLKREIDARKRFILCDSPNAQASKFVQSEVDYIRSKNRRYDIIDISQIDLDSPDVDKEVRGLIWPFIRRTSVFISRSMIDKETEDVLLPLFSILGMNDFNVTDLRWGLSTTDSVSDYEWEKLMKHNIRETLNNGYVIWLIGKNYSKYSIKEIEYAFQISPSQVLPVIISEQKGDILLDSIQNANILMSHFSHIGLPILNLSQITSPVEKAKVIVDELIALDLKNQMIHYENT